MDDELEIRAPLRRGASGLEVKRAQEWLTLHGFGVQPDGAFGPATQAAVRRFQGQHQLAVDGVVTPDTFARLTAPLRAALAPIAPAGRSLGELVVAYAAQHLAQAPREVGGDNRGPWVRLYMRGNDGANFRWCAGFVCTCVKQASDALGLSSPIEFTFSCDVLAETAKQRGLFIDGDTAQHSALAPGFLFLVRRARDDWQHVGIVTALSGETFDTIEGNTNDEGSANGFEVASRTRSFAGRDFVRVDETSLPIG